MKRLLRSCAVVGPLVALSAVVVVASPVNTPVISGLNQHVVAAGFGLVITGSHFSNDATGNCDAVGGTPTVHFVPLNGANEQTVSPDGQHCSDTQVQVPVSAAISGAARVALTDGSGHISRQAPVITIQPIASLSRSTGDVGSGPLQVIGANLQPPNLMPGSTSATYAGSPVSGLTNTGVTFSPGNASGDFQISFQVCDNGDDNCARHEPVTITAGHYTFVPPTLDPLTLTHQVVGSRLTLTGQNLGSSPQPVSVTFSGGRRGQSVTWSPGSIGVTVPPGAQPGAIGGTVGGLPVSGPTISLDPKLGGVSPSSGSANQRVHVSGFNFGNPAGTVTVGSAPEAIASWADQGVDFTISPDTDGGDATLSRADGTTLDLGNLNVVPHLDKAESDNLAAGAQVVLDGASLGANQGTARLGSADATPLLWSRASILLQLPAAIAPGTYPLLVTSATGATSNPINLTIIAAPSAKPTASGSHGQPTGVGGAIAPSFDNNHDFVKPIKPPSAVYFNLTADPHKVKAGESANVTVTLKLNDKPVKGAAVKLSMLFTPGDDYRFTPESGVTDANGVFTASVKTSKNPGDSVLAATSGAFSDQDHVQGTAPDGKVVRAGQASPPPTGGGFAPLLVLGVLSICLVAAGFYLNLRSMGR
ncbi:MAG: hypothetical protein ACR2MY_03550 [Candidatus Dormibacteria bacterium]